MLSKYSAYTVQYAIHYYSFVNIAMCIYVYFTSLHPGLSTSWWLLAWSGCPALTGFNTTLSPMTTWKTNDQTKNITSVTLMGDCVSTRSRTGQWIKIIIKITVFCRCWWYTYIVSNRAELIEGLDVEPRAFIPCSVQGYTHGVLLKKSR